MNDPHLALFPALEPGRARRPRLLGEQRMPQLAISGRSRFSATTVRCAPLKARLSDRLRSERGAATAEYAITTLAAVGFAGLLVVVLRSGEVRGMLTDIIRSALSIPA